VTHFAAPAAAAPADVTADAVATGLISAAGAVAIALLILYRRPLPGRISLSGRAAALAEGFQSGVINDYVAWMVLGTACLGGILVLIIR
jgi:hypothetical protein